LLSAPATVDTTCPDGIVNSFAEQIFSGSEFTVFPDPATSFVEIKLKDVSGEYIISIYNSLGTEVEKLKTENGQGRVNLENYKEGVYLIVAITGDELYGRKFIKM
jgi:hypothetical protein